MHKGLAGLLILFLLGGCASGRLHSSPPENVQAALSKAGMSPDVLGVVAYPIGAPSQGLRINPDQPRQPASTMKVVTTVVALERLGTNARGRTDLLSAAPPQSGVINGPLYLRGGADTDLDWGTLWSMLRQLREQGVQHVQGGIVVDRNLFRPARLDAGVPPFDEAPEFQYNVIPDALNLNTSLVGYVLQSDDKSVKARLSPALPGVVLDVQAFSLNDQPCARWEDSWKLPAVQADRTAPVVSLQGQFPRNCTQSLELNLLDRQWTSAMAVRQFWSQLGGTMEGADAEGATPPEAVVLVSHMGRPFAEVARNMMKRSDNPMTRLTYLRLGAAAAQPGEETLKAADRVVQEWFAANGIASDGLIMDNGSGLSRAARITPVQMAGVLSQAYKGPYFPELMSSLPVAGVDGTLSRRFKGTAVQGRGRLKTGTLRNADGLAGFVTDASNRTWIVVALLNHESASGKGRPVLDAIIEWVAAQQ